MVEIGELGTGGAHEDLYQHAPCGLLSAELAGGIIEVNATFVQWTGYSREEVAGLPFAELLTPGSRMFFETRCLPMLHLEGEVREVALTLRDAGGSTLPILLNATVRPGLDMESSVVRAAIFDASQRRDYEKELLNARRAAERLVARVQILQVASTTFGEATTEHAVTAALADIARTAADARHAAVLLVDEASGTLEMATDGPHPLGEHDLGGRGPEADALRLGEIVTVTGRDEAERRYPGMASMLDGARVEAMIAVPLVGNEALCGVLTCFFGRQRAFAEEELTLQQALVRQAMQALKGIRLQEQLLHLAMHDKLTGLANRELLQERLEQVVSASTRHERPIAVMFLDLDGFKAINDEFGHSVGDAVLVEVAARLRSAVRRSDTIARYGGDEFVIVCEDSDSATVTELAERIRQVVAEPLQGVGPGVSVTVSIGVAHFLADGRPAPGPDTLVRAADSALYQSKKAGRNRHATVSL